MRINKIVIDNFKNVVHGELSFENKRRPDGSSILALYGQNGSGKSALIDSILAFKLLLMGDELPQRFADFINKEAEFARFVFIFDTGTTPIKYEVEFGNDDGFPRIINETVRIAGSDTNRFRTIFTTDGYEHFGPKSLLQTMSKEDINDMECCHRRGASFFFSSKESFVEVKNERGTRSIKMTTDPFPADSDCTWVAELAHAEAEAYLYVVGTKEAENIESGRLTIPYDYINTGMVFEPEPIEVDGGYGVFEYAVDREGVWNAVDVSTDPNNFLPIPYELCVTLENGLFKSINYILEQLVPGMSVRLANAEDAHVIVDGIPMANVYIESCRENYSIPLSCESRGVQKLVSIAWLLVNVYNNPNFVAVIDEIDSGVFEYLLGEILKTIAEGGEGQLICTSHNLRPLEVIDKGYIAFTTTNPENRYMRLKNVKPTNNLRDFYYRSIFLGGQKESIYEPASSGDLSMGFIMANSGLNDEKADEDLREDQQQIEGNMLS